MPPGWPPHEVDVVEVCRQQVLVDLRPTVDQLGPSRRSQKRHGVLNEQQGVGVERRAIILAPGMRKKLLAAGLGVQAVLHRGRVLVPVHGAGQISSVLELANLRPGRPRGELEDGVPGDSGHSQIMARTKWDNASSVPHVAEAEDVQRLDPVLERHGTVGGLQAAERNEVHFDASELEANLRGRPHTRQALHDFVVSRPTIYGQGQVKVPGATQGEGMARFAVQHIAAEGTDEHEMSGRLGDSGDKFGNDRLDDVA